MAQTAGQIAKSHNIEIISRTVASTVTVGDIVGFNTSGTVRTAAVTSITSNIINGFGVALETVTSGTARIAVGNTWVYATCATGATVPMQVVAPTTSESVAGRFRALTATDTITGTIANFNLVVGRYMGHEDEVDDPSAATTAEVGIIRLGL